MNAARRSLLRTAGALGAAGVGQAALPLALNLAALSSAAAQPVPGDYRALVCLFLYGGNDHANTVLATDSASWTAYRAARYRANPSESIALDLSGAATPLSVLDLAPITAQSGRSFALHPALATIRDLFVARRAAIVANVGPLVQPTTAAQWRAQSVPLPPRLGSHNDQQSVWQSFGVEGTPTGWGGRMADALASLNGANATFTSVSAGGAVFLTGRSVSAYELSARGAVAVVGLNDQFDVPGVGAATRQLMTLDRAHLLQKEIARVNRRSIDAAAAVNAALPPAANFATLTNAWYPGGIDGLGASLQTVARMIAARGALGMRRQVFMVNLGGFDHHSGLMDGHGPKLAQVARAVGYFDALLADPAINARNAATLFTASDFGRTLRSNGDGTDHGWGSHHFVVGGAVRGGDVYGRFPAIGLNTADSDELGILLPNVSVDEFAAALGRWFGVSDAALADLLPNIRNFGGTITQAIGRTMPQGSFMTA